MRSRWRQVSRRNLAGVKNNMPMHTLTRMKTPNPMYSHEVWQNFISDERGIECGGSHGGGL